MLETEGEFNSFIIGYVVGGGFLNLLNKENIIRDLGGGVTTGVPSNTTTIVNKSNPVVYNGGGD